MKAPRSQPYNYEVLVPPNFSGNIAALVTAEFFVIADIVSSRSNGQIPSFAAIPRIRAL
jgi:hypothetical protein